MDLRFKALRNFRLRKYDKCIEACTNLLTEDPSNIFAWTLKMQALTRQVLFDDIEVIDTLIENAGLQDDVITAGGRPGTSLQMARQTASGPKTAGGPKTAEGPKTANGRLRTGIVRVNTAGNPVAPKTARTAQTAQWTRLGTASMLPHTQSFINVARLNVNKYAALPHVAKSLFEYLYYVEGNTKCALELARAAQEGDQDFYWQIAISRCLIRMGLVHQVLQSNATFNVQSYSTTWMLLLAKAFTIVDQPLNAVSVLEKGLGKSRKEISITITMARIYEELRMLEKSVSLYREVLSVDPSNIEAIACIATYYFYNDQAELALPLYRRLLQMGIHTVEVFNNVALCCFYCHQYDLVIPCFENALSVSTEKSAVAEVWYNLGHVSFFAGESDLAELCWRVSVSLNSEHGEAYNNLAVLNALKNQMSEARSLFQVSTAVDEELEEPRLNLARLVRDH